MKILERFRSFDNRQMVQQEKSDQLQKQQLQQQKKNKKAKNKNKNLTDPKEESAKQRDDGGGDTNNTVLDVNGGKIKVTVTRRSQEEKVGKNTIKVYDDDEHDDDVDDEFVRLYGRRFLNTTTTTTTNDETAAAETVSISNDTPVHDVSSATATTTAMTTKTKSTQPQPLSNSNNKRSRSIINIVHPLSIFRNAAGAGKRKVAANIDDHEGGGGAGKDEDEEDDNNGNRRHQEYYDQNNTDIFIATPEDLIITAQEIYEMSTGSGNSAFQQQQQKQKHEQQRQGVDKNHTITSRPLIDDRHSSNGEGEEGLEYDNCKSNCAMLSTNVVDHLFTIPVGTYFDPRNLPSLIDIFDGDDDDDDDDDNEEKDRNDVKMNEKERNKSKQRGEEIESEIEDDTTCSFSSTDYAGGGKKKKMLGRFRQRLGWKSWRNGLSTKNKRRQNNPRQLQTRTIKVQDDENEGVEVRLDAA